MKKTTNNSCNLDLVLTNSTLAQQFLRCFLSATFVVTFLPSFAFSFEADLLLVGISPLSREAGSAEELSQVSRVQPAYIQMQTYFLKRILSVSNETKEEKIRAFDAAVSNIDGAYNQSKDKYDYHKSGMPGNRVAIDVTSVPLENLLGFVNSFTKSNYPRLAEELRYTDPYLIPPSQYWIILKCTPMG